MISQHNVVLERTRKSSAGFKLRLDISKGESEVFCSCYCCDNVIARMLQASDYESVDQVSPFNGAVVDVLCEIDKCADVASVFTKYADLI